MINIGLVGCGKIAEKHAQLISSKQVKNVGIVAACDSFSSKVEKFSERFKISAYTDVHNMAKNADIDAFAVLTPSGLHASNVIELAQFRKPIIVEKPMALKLSDADKMILVCKSFGTPLFVVKQNRFNKSVVALKNAIDSGRFGKLILGSVRLRWCRPQEYYDSAPWRGTWEHDGGVLSNQAIHHIDLLEWMLGPVCEVNAFSTHGIAKIQAEDTAVVNLKFKNGALGVIEATTATRPDDLEGSLSILGEKGNVELGGFSADVLKSWNFVCNEPEDKNIFENSGSNPTCVFGYARQQFYHSFADCIDNGKKPMIDGTAGRRSLELVSAMYESIETNKTVRLPFTVNKCKLGYPV